VAVSPDFIWCPNLWGNLVPISWQSIRTVRKVIFPAFPAYVLESTDRRGVLFVPRFLTDFEEFVEKVEEYGGCDNQLYKAVWPAAEQNSV
jgi:hypothetical protein